MKSSGFLLTSQSVGVWLLQTSHSFMRSCNPRCLSMMSDLPQHPAVRTKAAMWSRRPSAVTAWRRPPTVPVKASRVTPPANIAHHHVSLLTRQILTLLNLYLVYFVYRGCVLSLFNFSCWFYAFLFSFLTRLFAPHLGPHSKPTKNLNLGWSHGVCQRCFQSQLGPRDRY